MLSIILSWMYVLFITLTLGFGVAGIVQKIFKYQIRQLDSLGITGLIVATVYAQFFSLFNKVGLLANIILLVLCVAILCVRRKQIIDTIMAWNKTYSISQKILIAVLFVLWAYFTSRGYMHYDSDLYHAQSIRWIEEYGIVPGLGNLHERFAYNSSFFALSALFSLKFLLGNSMHSMNGLFAFLLSVTCLPIAKSWKNKKFSLSDYARVGAIYYLTIITNEVVAPVSDIAVMLVIFFIVIKWLDVKEDTSTPYALLCVVGVYALSLKLTAGLILILLVKPAYQLIKEKRMKEILIYLAAGLLIAIPWFARTVIISGWLLYPFTALDIFSFDWEMDPYFINIDAMQIKTWGRALYAIGRIDTPITQWFPNWFKTTLSSMEKLLIVGALAATVVVLVLGVWGVVSAYKNRKQEVVAENTDLFEVLLVMIALAASYVFWQTSAPLMRYGYAYVLLLSLVVFGYIITQMSVLVIGRKKNDVDVNRRLFAICPYLVYTLILLYGIYKLFAVGQYVYDIRLSENYIWQQDYGVYDVESYEIDGETFYCALYGDRTGYQFFPSAPTKANISLRGAGMKDGFRPN